MHNTSLFEVDFKLLSRVNSINDNAIHYSDYNLSFDPGNTPNCIKLYQITDIMLSFLFSISLKISLKRAMLITVRHKKLGFNGKLSGILNFGARLASGVSCN